MSSVEYNGYELSPAPYQLPETDEWEVRVSITRHHDARGESLEKTVTASNRAGSREEAERSAIEFGKEIVDGKHGDVSLDDLS